MASQLPEIREIKSLLAQSFGENIEVLKCDTKLLTAPGENYGSVMLAVDATLKIADGTPEVKHFVAKLSPASEMLCKMFNIQETFKKEMRFYLDVIPALQKLEDEYKIEDNKIEDMFAKCFGARINLAPGSDAVDKDACIIMENLKVIGYDVGDRLVGFDLQNTELIIQSLAKFHAVPIALKTLKPEVFDNVVLPVIKGIMLGDGMDEKMFDTMMEEVTEVLETNDKCVPHMKKLVEALKYNMTGPYKTAEPRQPFATIVHTDYWVNNTMILKDKRGNPLHNKIVDLQMPTYMSGIHDLLFFMFSSVQTSVLYENIDNFLKFYHEAFIKILKQFNMDVSIFSWEKFQDELAIAAPLELGHILFMYSPILTERGQIDDMANFDEDAIMTKKSLHKDFNSRVINTVLEFIARKWL